MDFLHNLRKPRNSTVTDPNSGSIVEFHNESFKERTPSQYMAAEEWAVPTWFSTDGGAVVEPEKRVVLGRYFLGLVATRTLDDETVSPKNPLCGILIKGPTKESLFDTTTRMGSATKAYFDFLSGAIITSTVIEVNENEVVVAVPLSEVCKSLNSLARKMNLPVLKSMSQSLNPAFVTKVRIVYALTALAPPLKVGMNLGLKICPFARMKSKDFLDGY